MRIADISEMRHAPDNCLALHRHDEGYIALVLDGGYEEASVDGRFICGASTIVWHPPHHQHENYFYRAGATVMNLAAPEDSALPGHYCLTHDAPVRAIAALAEKNPAAASYAALNALNNANAKPEAAPRWLQLMAEALRRETASGVSSLISAHARRFDVTPEHAARGFKAYFGVTPAAYRREHRVRLAASLINKGVSFADIAYRCGYSDQSHFSKEFKKITGAAPRDFKAAV